MPYQSSSEITQLSSLQFIGLRKSVDIVGNLGAPLNHGSSRRYSNTIESVSVNLDIWEEEEEENLLVEISDNPLATGLI